MGMGTTTIGKTSSLVGLDIQADRVVAAEVATGRGHQLRKAAVAPLKAGLVHEGEFIDPEGIGTAIKALFRANRLSHNVRIGIANQRVVVRSVVLPAISDQAELDAAVRFQASERLPMPIEDAVLDYQIVERLDDSGGSSKLRVVLAAAPHQVIDRVLAVARKSGLKLQGIDISTFALIRALNCSVSDGSNGGDGSETADGVSVAEESADGIDPSAAAHGAVVYCHLGSMTNLAVAHGPACLFTRTLRYGIESMAEKLAAEQQLDIEDARGWLAHVGLGRELEAIEGDAELVAETRSVLEAGVTQLAAVIQASLDYYAAQAEARQLTHTIICGPGTAIVGLRDALSTHVPGSIAPYQPRIEDAGSVTPAELALAYGLAVDEVVV